MTVRLALVGAAPALANRRGAFPHDEPADAMGLDKARRAARRLPAADRVLVSPARVARDTAGAFGLPADIDPGLADGGYGRWSGRTLDDVNAEDPAGVARWLADPSAAPPGGEPLASLLQRVAAWLQAQQKRPGATLAITPAGVIRAAVVAALDAPAAAFWRLDVAPLSLTRLSGRDGRWTVQAFNERLTRAVPD